jgi:DNA invertase Pin-like site-specific DNA recombinase
MKAALYTRVSTADQSTAMQVRELEQYCRSRGWEAESFTDQISGSKERRPGLDALMTAVRKRAVDAVVVWKFDRFARSVSHLVKALTEFKALGIQFVSITEQIDTTTPAGELVFHVFAAVAQFERELIRERVRAALAHAKARGRKLGRPARVSVGFGRRVAELKQQGKSWGEIEAILKMPRSTLRRAAALCQKPTRAIEA